jgi:beta-phosphoglucomutase
MDDQCENCQSRTLDAHSIFNRQRKLRMLALDLNIGVLWDMDGVIVDSGEAHYISWQKSLSRFGISFNRRLFDETFGMNNRGILSLLLERDATDEDVERIGGLKEELFRRDVQHDLVPLPGAREWIERFSKSGFPQAVASSAPQQNIDCIIEGLELNDYFQALVSGSALSGKPDPATFLLAAKHLGVAPMDCLVIEDARVGIEAAKRGGMKCVAVCTTHSREELADADIVVERLSDLTPEDLNRLF